MKELMYEVNGTTFTLEDGVFKATNKKEEVLLEVGIHDGEILINSFDNMFEFNINTDDVLYYAAAGDSQCSNIEYGKLEKLMEFSSDVKSTVSHILRDILYHKSGKQAEKFHVIYKEGNVTVVDLCSMRVYGVNHTTDYKNMLLVDLCREILNSRLAIGGF